MSKEVLESKRAIVEEIKSKYNNAKGVVFVGYQGINVEQDTNLRKSFRESDVEYKIYKNRLIKIALDELGVTGYEPTCLEGATSVAFGKDEVTAPAILFKTKKTVPCLEAKFGIINGEVVDSARVEQLSKIPSKEVLISQLLCLLNAPISHLARTLDAIAKKEA